MRSFRVVSASSLRPRALSGAVADLVSFLTRKRNAGNHDADGHNPYHDRRERVDLGGYAAAHGREDQHGQRIGRRSCGETRDDQIVQR